MEVEMEEVEMVEEMEEEVMVEDLAGEVMAVVKVEEEMEEG